MEKITIKIPKVKSRKITAPGTKLFKDKSKYNRKNNQLEDEEKEQTPDGDENQTERE